MYDFNGQKYTLDLNLHGKWTEQSIKKYIARRKWLGNPEIIKIEYLGA